MNTDTLFTGTPTGYDAEPLAHAVRAVAARCDGAHEQDGQGFDGTDTHFGKRLASIPHDVWSADMIAEAYTMIGKYRRQLTEYGIDYTSIPAPAEAAHSSAARDQARQMSKRTQVVVEIGADAIIVQGPYDGERVAKFRAIPGRRWTGKVDRFPLTSAKPLLDCLDLLGCPVPDELRQLASTLPRDLPQVADKRFWVEGDRLLLTFPYDPGLVSLVRQAPDATWLKLRAAWSLALEPAALDFVQAHGFDGNQDAALLLAEAAEDRRRLIEMSRATDADLHVEGMADDALYPFQRAGVKYALEKRRTWIADEMGLGKTRQALAAVQAADAWPCLIVCPMSVKENWKIEAGVVLPGRRGEVIYGGKPRRFAGSDFYVVNYDLLHKHGPQLLATGFRSVVFDESHAHLSNPRLNRTKVAIELGAQIGQDPANLVLLLTGTPISNFADGLVPQLEVMGRLDDFGGKSRFWKRYVREATTYGFDAQRMVELHERLRATCYVRREKSQVLTELPPKTRQPIVISLTDDQLAEYRTAEQDLIAYIRRQAEEYALKHGLEPTVEGLRAAARAQAAQHLVAITTLKRLAAKARFDHAHEWIAEFQESTGRKLLVFGWHSDIVDDVASRYGGLRISGKDSGPTRQRFVEQFQTDDQARVIALQLKAGGVGITLTAASDVLFLEQGWTPATHSQAEDRVHRIGQENHVTIYYHLAEGTIDERVYGLIEAKRRLNRAIEDGDLGDDDESGEGSILPDLIADLVA